MTRRDYSSGSVKALPDRTGYRIWISAGRDENRKRIRVTEIVKGPRKAAIDRLQELQAQISRGEWRPGQRLTVSQFIARWWPMKAASLSPTGALGVRRLIDRHILPTLGSRPIEKVTAHEVSAMIGALVERGRLGQADHLFVTSRLVFAAARKARVIAVSPLDGLDRPARVHREMNVLTPEQWRLVRNHLMERQTSWAVPALSVLITCGLRRSELVGLRWLDFDAERSTLTVARSLHILPGGQVEVRAPKTARSRRLIALDPHTTGALLQQRDRAREWAEEQGTPWSTSDLIFCRPDGTPVRPHTLTQLWRRAATKLGLAVRLHDLRHSMATLLLAGGVDVKTVSARLGHASSAFTLDTYGHLVPDRESQAALELARLLNGPGSSLPAPVKRA